MLINEELHNLTSEEFEKILEFIGYDNLRYMLIKRSEAFPSGSKYYLSTGKGKGKGNANGSFWKGFRQEKLPVEKVKKFYIDEVLKNSSELNLENLFDDILRLMLLEEEEKAPFDRKELLERVNIEDNKNILLRIKDLEILNLYSRLYGVKLDDNELKKLEESIDAKNLVEEALNEQAQEFNELIQKKEIENDQQLAKLNKKIDSLNKKLEKKDNEIAKLNSDIALLNNDLPNKVNEKIKNIFKDYASKEAMNLFNDLNIFDENSAHEAFKSTVSELNNLLYNKKYSKLEDKIILQYLIIKVLEAEKETE